MQKSDTIAEITKALCKVQAIVESAKKDASNPFFKSKYADLSAVWDAIRKPLTDNNLAVAQTTDIDGEGVIVETLLLHISGEWIMGRLHIIPAKDRDPQAIGSAITYGRRYGLMAMIGVTPEDDDAEGAMQRGKVVSSQKTTYKQEPHVTTPEKQPTPVESSPTASSGASEGKGKTPAQTGKKTYKVDKQKLAELQEMIAKAQLAPEALGNILSESSGKDIKELVDWLEVGGTIETAYKAVRYHIENELGHKVGEPEQGTLTEDDVPF